MGTKSEIKKHRKALCKCKYDEFECECDVSVSVRCECGCERECALYAQTACSALAAYA